jgi:hypothetical protein
LRWIVKAAFYFLPVYQIPESFNKIRALILVFKIVGMFPYINTEKRKPFVSAISMSGLI